MYVLATTKIYVLVEYSLSPSWETFILVIFFTFSHVPLPTSAPTTSAPTPDVDCGIYTKGGSCNNALGGGVCTWTGKQTGCVNVVVPTNSPQQTSPAATAEPTLDPSLAPSPQPSSAPSPAPSPEPSPIPSAQPSPAPSPEPSVDSTPGPTQTPSAEPIPAPVDCGIYTKRKDCINALGGGVCTWEGRWTGGCQNV